MNEPTDADGFPQAGAENEGTIYRDENGMVWECVKLTVDEMADVLVDDEIAMEAFAWRPVGRE